MSIVTGNQTLLIFIPGAAARRLRL
jgi:hypothetical protein